MKTLQLLLIGAFLAYSIAAEAKATVHTVITTECGAYFGWQSLGELNFPFNFFQLLIRIVSYNSVGINIIASQMSSSISSFNRLRSACF
jgi:hypothetical protein